MRCRPKAKCRNAFEQRFVGFLLPMREKEPSGALFMRNLKIIGECRTTSVIRDVSLSRLWMDWVLWQESVADWK